jgi:hypothetical protein
MGAGAVVTGVARGVGGGGGGGWFDSDGRDTTVGGGWLARGGATAGMEVRETGLCVAIARPGLLAVGGSGGRALGAMRLCDEDL